ncbi:MAG: fluoride efflux transporter CrcB [Acidobacteriota bacterium]
MQKILFIGLAGLLGTLGRYALSAYTTERLGDAFPLGTLLVNIIGCFLAGVLLAVFQERWSLSPAIQSVLMVGFLGGFTTFSAYGLQTFSLLRDGQVGLATINVVASNVLGLLTVWAGYSLGKYI